MCLGCREVCGKINVRMLSVCLFWLRRLAISGSGWRPAALWTLARPPIVQLAEVGHLYPPAGWTGVVTYPLLMWGPMPDTNGLLIFLARKECSTADRLGVETMAPGRALTIARW